MSTSRVTVFVPTRNRREELAQALDGIDVLVVDDASEDGPDAAVRARLIPRVAP